MPGPINGAAKDLVHLSSPEEGCKGGSPWAGGVTACQSETVRADGSFLKVIGGTGRSVGARRCESGIMKSCCAELEGHSSA